MSPVRHHLISILELVPGTWYRTREEVLLWKRPYQIFNHLDKQNKVLEEPASGYVVKIPRGSMICYIETCPNNPGAIKVWHGEYFGWIHPLKATEAKLELVDLSNNGQPEELP